MKRVVDGVTYNTATSTIVARSAWQEGDEPDRDNAGIEQTLYLTRGGAFFLLTVETWRERDINDQLVSRLRNSIEPISRDKAAGWVLHSEVEIIDETVFGVPPEAAAEEEKSGTIYIRVPPSLKARAERTAKEAELSLSAWAFAVLRRCMSSGARD
jgi:hypothetical protein